MANPATQMNFPLTTLHLTDATAGVVDISGSGIACPRIAPAVIYDATAVTPSAGTANQVLTAGVAGGSVVWADLPASVTPSLAEVLAVGADANQVAITNLISLQLANVGAGSQVTLSSAVVSGSNIALNVNTVADNTGATKEFSRAYLPIGVGGVIYYLPLFSVPAP